MVVIMNNTDNKYFKLETELITAKRLLAKGFEEIDKLGYRNSFTYAALVLLSYGFERLLKSLILVDLMNPVKGSEESDSKSRLRKRFFTGNRGHDIGKLLDEVIRIVENKNYVASFNGGEAELEFVKNDVLLGELMDLLSDFAIRDRYYNLNVILGIPVNGEGPDTVWSRLEMAVIFRSKSLLELSREGKRDELFKRVSIEFKKALVRSAEAVTWFFAVGDFGEVGVYLRSALTNFTSPHHRVLYE